MRAAVERVFATAIEVERWPEFLEHYRWVRLLDEGPEGKVVEMAARRPFGPVGYPVWWVAEMRVVPARRRIFYRHIRGITRGMTVEWSLVESAGAVEVCITHEWAGPSWPLVGGAVARWVIGPHFISAIARRTLAGLRRRVEGI